MNESDYKPDIYQVGTEYIEAKAFSFLNPSIHPVHLSNSLATTRHRLNLFSLSANICGIGYRVISIAGIDSCMFNPIINESSGEVVMEETSMLKPGYTIKIKRPEIIRVRYLTALQEVRNQAFVGLTARLIQQEIDNLNQFDWVQRASRFHKEQADKRYKRISKQ